MIMENERLNEIKEALLEGKAVELFPDDKSGQWYARIGMLEHEVWGDTAADVFKQLSLIVAREYT